MERSKLVNEITTLSNNYNNYQNLNNKKNKLNNTLSDLKSKLNYNKAVIKSPDNVIYTGNRDKIIKPIEPTYDTNSKLFKTLTIIFTIIVIAAISTISMYNLLHNNLSIGYIVPAAIMLFVPVAGLVYFLFEVIDVKVMFLSWKVRLFFYIAVPLSALSVLSWSSKEYQNIYLIKILTIASVIFIAFQCLAYFVFAEKLDNNHAYNKHSKAMAVYEKKV